MKIKESLKVFKYFYSYQCRKKQEDSFRKIFRNELYYSGIKNRNYRDTYSFLILHTNGNKFYLAREGIPITLDVNQSWWGSKKLAQKLHLKKDTANNALNWLDRRGFIDREVIKKGNRPIGSRITLKRIDMNNYMTGGEK